MYLRLNILPATLVIALVSSLSSSSLGLSSSKTKHQHTEHVRQTVSLLECETIKVMAPNSTDLTDKNYWRNAAGITDDVDERKQGRWRRVIWIETKHHRQLSIDWEVQTSLCMCLCQRKTFLAFIGILEHVRLCFIANSVNIETDGLLLFR